MRWISECAQILSLAIKDELRWDTWSMRDKAGWLQCLLTVWWRPQEDLWYLICFCLFEWAGRWTGIKLWKCCPVCLQPSTLQWTTSATNPSILQPTHQLCNQPITSTANPSALQWTHHLCSKPITSAVNPSPLSWNHHLCSQSSQAESVEEKPCFFLNQISPFHEDVFPH